MQLKRTRYQYGSIEKRKRKLGPDVWVMRYYESGQQKYVELGSVEQYRTRVDARRSPIAEGIRLSLNKDVPQREAVSFGALVEKYELPERFSTQRSYASWLKNYILPRWGSNLIIKIQPLEIEKWLNGLSSQPDKLGKTEPLSGKSKEHIKSIMYGLFDLAQKLGLTPIERNLMELVEIKGGSRRRKVPSVMQPDDIKTLVAALEHEYAEKDYSFLGQAVLLAVGTGLRCSELFGLKWEDILWLDLRIDVKRGIVCGREGETKSEASQASVPLDPMLAEALLAWRAKSRFAKDSDWVFASPFAAGEKPYNPWRLQQYKLAPLAARLRLGRVGWHTFRHTYRALLNQNGTPVGIQQELMRHSDVRITTKDYGKTIGKAHREANSGVVRMVTG